MLLFANFLEIINQYGVCLLSEFVASNSKTQEVTMVYCEDSIGRLSCHPGRVLNITSANYGRTAGPSVCPPTLTNVTDCSASSSLAKVRCACQDMEKCDLHASSFLFGDPCVGTSKYLQVKLNCVLHTRAPCKF